MCRLQLRIFCRRPTQPHGTPTRHHNTNALCCSFRVGRLGATVGTSWRCGRWCRRRRRRHRRCQRLALESCVGVRRLSAVAAIPAVLFAEEVDAKNASAAAAAASKDGRKDAIDREMRAKERSGDNGRCFPPLPPPPPPLPPPPPPPPPPFPPPFPPPPLPPSPPPTPTPHYMSDDNTLKREQTSQSPLIGLHQGCGAAHPGLARNEPVIAEGVTNPSQTSSAVVPVAVGAWLDTNCIAQPHAQRTGTVGLV